MKTIKILFGAITVLSIVFIACEKNQRTYILANANKILWVTMSADSVPADGKSFIVVTANLTPGADLRQVGFTTTAGLFRDSNKAAITLPAYVKSNDSVIAQTWLVSSLDTISVVRVDISVQGLDTTAIVRFVTAFPDSLHVECAVGSIVRGFNSTAPVTATLFRTTGTPSLHQVVMFSALEDNGQPIGEFIGIPQAGSDSNGMVKPTFLLKDSTYTGRIRIIGSCNGGGNRFLTDTTTLFVSQN